MLLLGHHFAHTHTWTHTHAHITIDIYIIHDSYT